MMTNNMKSALYLAALLSGTASFNARAEDEVPNPSGLAFVSKSEAQQRYKSGLSAVPVAAPVANTAALPLGQAEPFLELKTPDLPPLVMERAPDSLANPDLVTASVEPPFEPPAAKVTQPEVLHDRPAQLVSPPLAPGQNAMPQAAPAGEPALSAEAEALKAAVTALVNAPALKSGDKKRREMIATVYAARNFEPLWVKDHHWTTAAQGVLNRLDKANEDGLVLADARLPSLSAGKFEAEDVHLSDLATQYIAQAMGSRIDPLSVSKLITARPATPDFAASLRTISAAPNGDEALQASNPPHSGYAALRLKLAELRRETVPVAHRAIPAGPVLKVGMKDERVPLIRERFGLDMEPTASTGAIVYDTKMAAAVADFQTSSGLPASGTLTPRTIAMLSGGQPSKLEAEIVANMEVWRWVPRELGRDHIEVNIPDFTARLYRGETLAYSTRVVVGKTDTPTPIFSNKMQFLIVNPYWNVPLSIINKEMLPKLAADPDYFARHGYELIQSKGQFYVRQPPGDANALGRIKFMFPNEHSVYLHDTPSKSLFAQSQRAFSHGCVRVDQPFKFAEAVLGAGWSEQRIRAMIGGQERTVNLPEALTIHLMYLTARVDDTGKLILRDDIYGYTRKIKLMLGLDG